MNISQKMKFFEKNNTPSIFVPGVPVLVRIDGRAFHTFTKGMDRPYDDIMSQAMILTTKYLVKETHAKIGYTQSDEISLLFYTDQDDSQIFFNGKREKIVSTTAALASVIFNRFMQDYGYCKNKLEIFDSRVWWVPTKRDAVLYFRWREEDATKNSIQMASQNYYSHKDLKGKKQIEQLDMLHEKGINWNNYPRHFKRGTFVRKENFEKELTKSELEKIPEKHRPSGSIIRSIITEKNFPPLSRIGNKEYVFFDGCDPLLVSDHK